MSEMNDISDLDELGIRSSIQFNPKPNKTLITISQKGIKFHLENFPNYKPEDFAKEFMKILEESYDLKFIKKD